MEVQPGPLFGECHKRSRAFTMGRGLNSIDMDLTASLRSKGFAGPLAIAQVFGIQPENRLISCWQPPGRSVLADGSLI